MPEVSGTVGLRVIRVRHWHIDGAGMYSPEVCRRSGRQSEAGDRRAVERGGIERLR